MSTVRSDTSPPYSFPDRSSPLFSVTLLADGIHGWAVGSGGTILRSGDGGKSWRRVEGLPTSSELHAIAFSADGRRGCAVGHFGTILRTGDGGQTWQTADAVPGTSSLHSVAMAADGQRAWIVGAAGAILRSSDGGQAWQKVDGIPAEYVLETVAFASDGQHGWAAGDDGVLLLSGDGGTTWQRAVGIAKSEYLMSVAFAADGLRGWTVGDYGAMYHSADGGRTWQKYSDTLTDGYLNTVGLSPDGQRGWVAGDNGTLFLTADGGQSWQKVAGVPTTEDIYSVAFAPDGKLGGAAGDFGTLLRTIDGGQVWGAVSGPPTEQSLDSIFMAADGQHGWVAGALGSILRTGDGGLTWLDCAGANQGAALNAITFAADGRRGWAVGGGGLILLSADGGENWQKVAGSFTGQALRSVAFAADGQRGWAVGVSGTILDSTDGGRTWQRHPGVLTGSDLNAVAFTADGVRGWAAGAGGTILLTTDGGQKWRKVAGVLTQRSLRSVAFAPDGLHGCVVGESSTALRTTDGGESWQIIAGGASTLGANSVAFAADGRHGWAVGDEGSVYRTADGGEVWWTVSQDAKEGALNSVVISADGQRGWAVGAIGTVLRTSAAEADRRPFDGEVSSRLESRDGMIRPVVSFPGRVSPSSVGVRLSLSGPNATGDLAKGFVRIFNYGQPFEGWKTGELGPGVYTCHVEVFDGWNIVIQDFQFGNGPWARFAGFMGWDIAFSQPLEFAKGHATQNLVLLLAIYCLAILALFAIRPYGFVWWHEKAAPVIAALPFPTKATDKVTQLAGLFLLGQSRSLDAVVRRYAPMALAELQKIPEAAARPIWVAAPLQIEDELFGTSLRPFERPASLAEDKVYIRGLVELEKHLGKNRWWISIEGPGGVGKSALAFQLARWFAAPEPQGRFGLPQAIPLFIRSPKGGLDEEVLAELKRILELPKMSPQLSGALLSRRRVMALIDGVSEKAADIEGLELGQLNPAKGAALTHFAVMTSRRRMQIAEVVKVLPSPVDLGSMDAVLDRYLDDVVGAGRFNPSQRESIREALKGIMGELSGEGGRQPQIPMVFVKLIIQRADNVLAKDEAPGVRDQAEASLPKDLAELVDAYLASLLEARPDRVAEAAQARRAALACVGPEGLPRWRPLAAYASKSLALEHIEALVTTGLMVRDGADVGDPRYKFALDPIADYLAAKELVIAVRDGNMTPDELKALSSHFVSGSDVPAKIVQIARALDVGLG